MDALTLTLAIYSGLISILIGLVIYVSKRFIESTSKKLDELKENVGRMDTKIEVFNQNIKTGYQNIVNLDKRITANEKEVENIKQRLVILEHKTNN